MTAYYTQDDPQQTPRPAARRGPAPWAIVLLTLGAVALAAVVFVAGIFTGIAVGGAGGVAANGDGAVSGGTGQQPAPGGEPSQAAPETTPGGGSGDFDSCLVGTWEGVEHEEDWKTEQGAATLTGLSRAIEFTADGTETITYDDDEATVTTDKGALPIVFDGQIVYRASTQGTTMSFALVSSAGTVTVTGPDGSSKSEDITPGVGEVTYTCDEDRFSQEAEGYRSVYERTS